MLDSNNNVLASFTYGRGVAPMSMRTNGHDFFFHTDALGSVVALTDINGNIVETYEYEAFGKAVVTDVQGNTHRESTVGNPFMFAGAEFDPETGFYHMGFRYYGPDTGRFIVEDPLGFDGGNFNLYSYVSDAPTQYTDPSGLIYMDNPPGWPKTHSGSPVQMDPAKEAQCYENLFVDIFGGEFTDAGLAGAAGATIGPTAFAVCSAVSTASALQQFSKCLQGAVISGPTGPTTMGPPVGPIPGPVGPVIKPR